MVDTVTQLEAWDQLVADPGPRDHIVQLYQEWAFLNRAVCRFVGAGLAKGEGIILVSTLPHWNGFRAHLEAEGMGVQAARKRGQLMVVDADELLPRFMRDAMPDPAIFPGVFGDVVAEARAAGGYEKVRVWGEMVNVLWERGDFDQLIKKHDMAIFCSFLMDNFNDDVHTRMLPRLGTNHSHLIPVEDYARLEHAVVDALRETVGPEEARVLDNVLLSRYRPPFNMPRSQALLLALRQFLPTVADPVLQRSRELYTASGTA
jgi:MEDS: MEthanogen/methylotroph, DcmR Sensory domain